VGNENANSNSISCSFIGFTISKAKVSIVKPTYEHEMLF
jgi:hypothetical protein